MPQPPTKRPKKGYNIRLRDCRERNRKRRRAETTAEREIRLLRDRERRHRKIAAESTQEREARRLANLESTLRRRRLAKSAKERERQQEENQRREAESTPSLVKCDIVRRSSRAAIVAAKKISTTVCNYNLKDPDFNSYASVPPKPPVKTEKAQKRKKSPSPPPLPPPPPEPPIEIGLDMECEEEILSETQAETLSKAQSHYHLVMKGLRELVQCNVKVIQTDPFGTVILNPSPTPFQTTHVKNTVIPPSIASQTNRVVIRTDARRIVPVAHTVRNPQPLIIRL